MKYLAPYGLDILFNLLEHKTTSIKPKRFCKFVEACSMTNYMFDLLRQQEVIFSKGWA